MNGTPLVSRPSLVARGLSQKEQAGRPRRIMKRNRQERPPSIEENKETDKNSHQATKGDQLSLSTCWTHLVARAFFSRPSFFSRRSLPVTEGTRRPRC
ncbi:unnamed protein product, partial [Amoebophrya sp. A25]|eukprot:GSA25T00015613001.1